jgi:sterol desaturase/sphingolipid hydroxylase (fatty acid hydroxylase superfamily)
MKSQVIPEEAAVRLGCFLGIFAIMAMWECLGARRERPMSRWQRWPGNIGLVFIDTFLARIAAPAGAVGFALFAQSKHLGLFNVLGLPGSVGFLVSLVVLDLAIYFQHRLFHHVPILWRLHRMHHADLDIDVTTGARFHPIEILLSLGIKFLVVVALGAPPLAVFVFEVALNATSMFNHSNVRIATSWERMLRCIVVTPDMHRVHHSILSRETNSNYGFNFPWWDRLFRTYRPQPEAGHDKMTIGIHEFRDPRELQLPRMLVQPLRSSALPPESGKS